MKRKEDLIFIGAVIIIIMGGILKPIFKPVYTNKLENRHAYTFPTFNINSFVNKNFQNDIENAFSDQIPFSYKMKLTIKNLNVFLKLYSSLLLSKNHYYSIDNNYSLYKNNLVYKPRKFEDTREILDKRIKNINSIENS